ncbi:MAG: amidase [Actinomycetota bacterium]|nr:amidase [Actinomycetota bacterium]
MTNETRVQSALNAAHESQPLINAFTSIDDQARQGSTSGPLAGVPIGLKDLIDQRGHVTTCGSAFYRKKAETSATAVDRLEEAGAVIIGRTGLHEFAFGFSSENPHWGPVRNPWDLSTSTGGSSGGSGAAVAAGVVPIAIGTDTGGSVRVPAALCGTFGLKVTRGRIPLDGVFPLVPSIDTLGPLADSMTNIELSYRAMSGDVEPAPSPGRLRLGIPQPWYDGSPTNDDIAATFDSAVEALKGLGHEIHAVTMPDVFPGIQLWNAIAGEVRDVHREYKQQGKPYGADVEKRISDADDVTDQDRSLALEWQQMIRTRFADAFATVDYLITPTVPVRRKVIGEDLIGDRHYRSVLSYFSAVVNHSLHPALAVPLAGSGTPPASLQIIGGVGSEPAMIGLGKELESGNLARFTKAPTEFT